jgi:tetratricopeptide (TPR) repeat protein
MSRALAAAGWSYVALCGLILASHREIPRDIPRGGEPPHPAVPYGGDAGSWFAQIKPFCNAVEVEVQQQRTPAPSDASGAGYSAACYALAGKIDRARAVIDSLPTRLRPQAAGIVFNVGHPVADAGDDASAGPIMRLVVEYTPENYMALYHAGISEYQLGQYDYARTHLERFLELYQPEDGWRANAQEVLGRIR